MSKQRSNSPPPNLGELELRLLNALWETPNLSAKDLHRLLHRRTGLNTIQSALDRLYKKSLLERRKESHAFLYHAKVERAELTTTLISGVIERLQMSNLEPVLSSFVDYAEGVDDATLNRLERMIRERKQKRMQNDD